MAYIERAITPGKSTLIKHEFIEYNRANFDDKLTRGDYLFYLDPRNWN